RGLKREASQRIREKQAEASEKNKLFFNGPNVRLIHWTDSPPGNGPGATLERNVLSLYLGPVGWYDFEGTNGLVAEKKLNPERAETYERWVRLSKMIHDFDVRHSRLSNILCNAITILTSDGQIGYGERRDRQSTVPHKLSCAVGETTNRYFDETDRRDPSRLINSVSYSMRLSDGPDNNYIPRVGRPHPVATVRRGLNEEASKHMTDHVLERGIKVTGLDFGLDVLHPFLLW